MRKIIGMMFLLLSVKVFAGDITVFDVYSGQEWKLVSFYKNVKSRQPGGNHEVSVSYPAFADSSQQVTKQVNNALMRLALVDWQSDEAYRVLLNEVRKRYNELNRNNRSGSQGDPYGNDRIFMMIEDIDLTALSVYREECWLVLNFSVTFSGDERLDVKRYYKANLKNGRVVQVNLNGNIPNVDALRNFLAPLFTSQYVLVTDKLSAADKTPRRYVYPEDQEEVDGYSTEDEVSIDRKNNETVCRDLCKYIDFNELDVFRLGWGVVVGFQEGTASSRVYNTESFALFLTGAQQDSLALLLNRPDLAADDRLIKSEFKKFNYYKLSEGLSSVRFAPPVEKLVSIQPTADRPVKAVRIDSYQVFESGQANFRGYFVRTFNRRGLPDAFCYIDENKDTASSEYYQYDGNGNLAGSRGISDRKNFKTKTWQYDASDNVTFYQQLDGDDLYASYFFYNGNLFYYIEVDGKEIRYNRVEKVSFKNREVCFKTACYVVNEQLVPRYQTSRKYISEELQTGFDAKGRLMETHAENDRYNYYFNYDARDRFISQEVYEYQRLLTSVKYLYKEDAVLPYEQQKHSYGNGQDIFEKEVYTWEFW